MNYFRPCGKPKSHPHPVLWSYPVPRHARIPAMTSETQTFINPRDIRAVRIECGACHAKTIIPLDTPASQAEAREFCTRFKCRHCPSEWFTHQDSDYLNAIAQLIQALAAVQGRKESKMSFTLEVFPPVTQL
jgi:hypothetical protein